MAVFDYECPYCGVFELTHPCGETIETCPNVLGIAPPPDPSSSARSSHEEGSRTCGLPIVKLFNFFPGCKWSRIRTASDQDPAYYAWLNSDSVKADLKSGKLRPIGKHEDQAHGDGGTISRPVESRADKERRFAGYEDEFHRLGCPTQEQQQKLLAEGKI